MKKVKHYTVLSEDLIERLNIRDFKFVEFSNIMKNVEIITIENDDIIEGYAIIEHSNNMNQDFYIDILSEIEDRYSDMMDNLDVTENQEVQLLDYSKEALSILKDKDFYYISYLECIPSNAGNGTAIVKYIKDNYHKTVLIPSGYTPKESSVGFWKRQGYKKSEFLMFNY